MGAILAWVVFIWFFIGFCDTIFKTCMFHPYFRALQVTGLDIRPLMINLQVTRYNRFINQLGRWRSSALKIWFDTGAIITCVISFPCLIIFMFTLYQMYNSSSMEDYGNSVLLPVIPGFNFPLSHWMYYITVILLSSVVHEFGHALAASRERVSIEEFGFALCFILPLAFVNLRLDQFRQISRWQQMRICCAGIWHNIVLALVALLLGIFLVIPLAPLYSVGNGVTVVEVNRYSGLDDISGFEIGDQIHSIGDCNVDVIDDWKLCLKEMSNRPQPGLCAPKFMKSMSTCLNSSVTSGFLHFKAIKVDARAHAHAKHAQPLAARSPSAKGVCLVAREAMQDFSPCDQNSACKDYSECIFPVLPSKMHRLVPIKRHQKPSVLYIGLMDELFADVQVSRFVQKYKLFPVSFIEAVTTFMQYMVMFSSGLACLNMLPIFSLDGELIIELLVHICFERLVPRHNQRRLIYICISRIAFGVAICLIILTAYKFYIFAV